ncbi:girdin-like [Bombyx mandarina]|uniref:Girdin-like n=1 Tax=Bombyx mandarina TaxID=7092 RepID=A0A6J2K1Q5_BOMMA|nr:girdin-like [Bombyx mandarina]
MSFITKRERVFKEFDLFDLPSRNEGKLKAYASCTDARAWSHFCSDKTEHLVEIIKRNNERCRPKYVPTDVIVDTLMVAKNTEIARLKRKIEEFEQMLAAYDQLELSCEQKCEIANAHATIKAANKELEDMFLDLNLSGFTEIDSEAFETGKSRGDEWTYDKENRPRLETKGNQAGFSCPCDASTSATDPRIEEMKETIITKDAKLSAMQNTIAVMENDVCEPYCIYAHIYTALEKIFGILCQNDKYKQYLDLLTTGKDIRNIDLKGKILFKLKVLEKFSLALIAPCSQNHNNTAPDDCPCYKTQIVARLETTYALSSETKQPNLDNKRALLIADIMDNEEMKEILSRESANLDDEDVLQSDNLDEDTCSIDGENLKRLKNLQENYNDLMVCYENLKHERNCLQLKCHKYDELECELQALRTRIREYNALWSEKEYFRKRSVDLDDLKEHYLVLSNETSNLETKLKSEIEINKIKTEAMEGLRKDNIVLEKKINEIEISFEKERNTLECKLKETECKVMCQEQQIKSLNVQIDKLIEQEDYSNSVNSDKNALSLLNQIESLKEEVFNLKDALCYGEEERQTALRDFQDNLKIINDLKLEIEDWKNKCEKIMQQNDELERFTENYGLEVRKLTEENKNLLQENEEKCLAVENLMNIVNTKSKEIDHLISEIDHKNIINNNLITQVESHASTIEILESEKTRTLTSLEISKCESQELLKRTQDYENLVHQNNELSKELSDQVEEYNMLKEQFERLTKDNEKLQYELHEIEKLQEINKACTDEIAKLKDERDHLKTSLVLTKKESEVLDQKLMEFENLRQQFHNLRESEQKLSIDKYQTENLLGDENSEQDTAGESIQLYSRESSISIKKLYDTENLKEDILSYHESYQNLKNENLNLKTIISNLEKEKINLIDQISNLRHENEKRLHTDGLVSELEEELNSINKTYELLMIEKNKSELYLEDKNKEVINLQNQLESRIAENKQLRQQLIELDSELFISKNNFKSIETENDELQKENEKLTVSIRKFESDLNLLQKEYEAVKMERNQIEKVYETLLVDLNTAKKENEELAQQSQTLLSHNNDLENALIMERSLVKLKPEFLENSYEEIIREIIELKDQKIGTQNKIRELMDKLEESEYIILKLTEEVVARNHKIVILENHINEVEDEVRRLQVCVSDAIIAGEQIRENSIQKIDESVKAVHAHHSKATHNIRMELDKLKNENILLEQKLSNTKLDYSDSFNSRNEILSNMNRLQNDNEIIITDIKQIELEYIGDSELSPEKCDAVDVLHSLERIRNYMETKKSKNIILEQTLLKVQSSSQLLLCKADEGKRIVEVEKQKIITEKEEAIKQRQDLEASLLDLKQKLEKQISTDQNVIKDLEAEILNKDLIINNINKSTESYITELKNDINSWQELYENATRELKHLQEQLQSISDEKNQTSHFIEVNYLKLEEKSEEIAELQKTIEKIRNRSFTCIGTNTSGINLVLEIKQDKAQQVDGNVNINIKENHFKNNYGSEIKTNDIEHNDETKRKIPESVHSTDMFIVYKSSETDTPSTGRSKEPTSWPHQNHSEVVETLKIHPKNQNTADYRSKKREPSTNTQTDENIATKRGINVKLPRVELINSSQSLSLKSETSSSDTFHMAKPSETTFLNSEAIEKPPKTELEPFNSHQEKVNSIFDSIYSENYQNNIKKSNVSGQTISLANDTETLNVTSRPNSSDLAVNPLNNNLQTKSKSKNSTQNELRTKIALNYVLDTIELDRNLKNTDNENSYSTRKTQSASILSFSLLDFNDESNLSSVSSRNGIKTMAHNLSKNQFLKFKDQGVLVRLDNYEKYEQEIDALKKTLKNTEEDFKKKLDALKLQYDNNIKNIKKEHDNGVNNLQNLHEETLHDIIKIRENEIENLRTLSIEAMKKADKLEKDNSLLKHQEQYNGLACFDEEVPSESSSHRNTQLQRKVLTQTNVEAFDVKPKTRIHGPCTCSLDVNMSDTIRNIFQQVDNDQRKLAERTYLKYILNKILSDSVKSLDAQELSFLHLKICRTWKMKLNKEEAFQMKINTLESELLTKQKHTQQHIADLDRKVAQERRALQEIREAVFRSNPRDCTCKIGCGIVRKRERRAAGDIAATLLSVKSRPRRSRAESNRAVIPNLNVEESRKNNVYEHDERPTRLRKNEDKQKHYHKK